jgi:hypothetical protein
MTSNAEPGPRKNLLKARPYSFMNFMPEEIAFDKETSSVVRFRRMFEMPNWDGVEEDEHVFIVEDPADRLDKIADRFWGADRLELYWVIAARNNMDLPDANIRKGTRLRIPSRRWIDDKFLPQAQAYIER